MSDRFRSLRVRLLLPLLAVALLASLAVAVGSYALGGLWAQQEAASRYQAIRSTLAPASFPMTGQVIRFIATLTETELVLFDDRGTALQSSLPLDTAHVRNDLAQLSTDDLPERRVRIGERSFRYAVFARRDRIGQNDLRVAVLFDEERLHRARLRAAILPLVTGLSTVVLLTSVTLLMTGRLVRRITSLQSRVNQIAAGDFAVQVASDRADELGVLGGAVARMAGQLQTMWKTLERQQGQKLLHQIAGGLAHQLRNSITGARMAVELHEQRCDQVDDSLTVAISQLEQTEDHVRRLLLVASGKQDEDRPQRASECVQWIQATLSTTAKHLRVALNWHLDCSLEERRVADGPSLHAAISNLGLNALQEATQVHIHVDCPDDHHVRFTIVDNGPGPDPHVAAEIFEPFVSSKPEGLGLGLPLVARAAARLGGEVAWKREADLTKFTFSAALLPSQDATQN